MPNNQDKDKNIGSLLGELKLELSGYIDKQIKLFKLDAFEKIGISFSTIAYGLIVSSIIIGFLFFLFFGMAFFIGELLNSWAAGFGIMALFSLLVLIITIFCGKYIKSYVLNKTIIFLHKVDRNEAE